MKSMEINKFRNLAVNKTFVAGARKLKVSESGEGCQGCCFDSTYGSFCDDLVKQGIIPYCSCKSRADRKNVIFVEV